MDDFRLQPTITWNSLRARLRCTYAPPRHFAARRGADVCLYRMFVTYAAHHHHGLLPFHARLLLFHRLFPTLPSCAACPRDTYAYAPYMTRQDGAHTGTSRHLRQHRLTAHRAGVALPRRGWWSVSCSWSSVVQFWFFVWSVVALWFLAIHFVGRMTERGSRTCHPHIVRSHNQPCRPYRLPFFDCRHHCLGFSPAPTCLPPTFCNCNVPCHF